MSNAGWTNNPIPPETEVPRDTGPLYQLPANERRYRWPWPPGRRIKARGAGITRPTENKARRKARRKAQKKARKQCRSG